MQLSNSQTPPGLCGGAPSGGKSMRLAVVHQLAHAQVVEKGNSLDVLATLTPPGAGTLMADMVRAADARLVAEAC